MPPEVANITQKPVEHVRDPLPLRLWGLFKPTACAVMSLNCCFLFLLLLLLTGFLLLAISCRQPLPFLHSVRHILQPASLSRSGPIGSGGSGGPGDHGEVPLLRPERGQRVRCLLSPLRARLFGLAASFNQLSLFAHSGPGDSRRMKRMLVPGRDTSVHTHTPWPVLAGRDGDNQRLLFFLELPWTLLDTDSPQSLLEQSLTHLDPDFPQSLLEQS